MFADPIASVRAGRLGPADNYPDVRLEQDRQEDFANSDWVIQSRTNLPELYRLQKWLTLEDAREAIIIGRKLGYLEDDILHYIVCNYIPEAFMAINSHQKIPEDQIILYPNLNHGR